MVLKAFLVAFSIVALAKTGFSSFQILQGIHQYLVFSFFILLTFESFSLLLLVLCSSSFSFLSSSSYSSFSCLFFFFIISIDISLSLELDAALFAPVVFAIDVVDDLEVEVTLVEEGIVKGLIEKG